MSTTPCVKALVRWATGKKLTDRLPKQSLVSPLPSEPGVRSTPSPHEGRTGATVGHFPPDLGEHIAFGPREDGHPSATEASPQRDSNGQNALGLRVDNTCRKISRASSTTSFFEARTASRSNSQDLRVTLRCGYGNTGSSRSFSGAALEVLTHDRLETPDGHNQGRMSECSHLWPLS